MHVCTIYEVSLYMHAHLYLCMYKCASGSMYACVHAHRCACIIVRELGTWEFKWGMTSLITTPYPHSYVENQHHLQHLELRDLQGLGELRNL